MIGKLSKNFKSIYSGIDAFRGDQNLTLSIHVIETPPTNAPCILLFSKSILYDC